MQTLSYKWSSGDETHTLTLEPVPGTAGTPYTFGSGTKTRQIEIGDLYISSTPVTQALWSHIMGINPATKDAPRCPVDNVSWDHIREPDGFLDRINSHPLLGALTPPGPPFRFRLPSETEWEYAARGGPRWTDGFVFSGSNDIDEVAWSGRRWTGGMLKWNFAKTTLGRLLFGSGRFGERPGTHDVAQKAPNQLGLYDMCGNVWEWCEDTCVDDLDAVPPDGTPYRGPGDERRLRGGCFNNWDFLCTVAWRYGIEPRFHDGCIGFRLALAASTKD